MRKRKKSSRIASPPKDIGPVINIQGVGQFVWCPITPLPDDEGVIFPRKFSKEFNALFGGKP